MIETVSITGLDQLAANLKELPQRISRNALRGAVAAGAAVIRNEAKQRAPVYTGPVSQGHPPPGTLKRAIVQKQIREESGLLKQVFYVTVRSGKKYAVQLGKKRAFSQDAYYWKFVEFGTSKMAARPFMRPAFEAQKMAAIEAIRTYLAERIAKEADALKK